MARTLGRDGVVKVATAAVALVTSWSVEESAGTIDASVLGDTWTSSDIDMKSWTASLEVQWDPTDTNGQEALAIGDEVTIHLQPGGSTTGEVEYTGSAYVTGVSRTGSQGSHVTASISLTGNGSLTRATLP